MPDFLWLPHRITLTLSAARVRPGKSYASGTDQYETPPPTEFDAFVEPKSARWSLEQGLDREEQAYLVIAPIESIGQAIAEDLIAWNGRTLKVMGRPSNHDYGDGYTHSELIATEATTRRRQSA